MSWMRAVVGVTPSSKTRSPSSAFTNALLPALNSPTTTIMKSSSSCWIEATSASRSAAVAGRPTSRSRNPARCRRTSASCRSPDAVRRRDAAKDTSDCTAGPWSPARAVMLGPIVKPWMGALAVALFATPPAAAQTPSENGVAYARAVAAADRTLQAWLKDADPKTGLMPDRLDGDARVATPHNFSADLYPYLILTARLTDPPLYEGRMLEMLRNEVRYMTAAASVPGNLDLRTGTLGEPSLFGAGEYAKDGLITVTELLGRTPWFYRMADMVADAMDRAPHESRWGAMPALDSELNGDFLQVLVRLYTMTGEARYLAWARRIGDAYVEE